jgi:uncharacterized protein YuzE
MKQRYLQVTYRRGRPLAAYLYLPHPPELTALRTRRYEPGLIVDLASDGQPIGIEIVAPEQLTLAAINRVLCELGCFPMIRADLAPLVTAAEGLG